MEVCAFRTMRTVFACMGIGAATMSVLAQTESDVAPSTFRDITIPFDSKLVTYWFGPATPPVGESTTLDARGPVLLYLSRGPTTLPDGATVTVAVNSPGGTRLALWTTELTPVTAHGFIKRVDLPPSGATIDVNVVDRADGGPTRSRPYTLVLEAWPLSSTASIALSEPKVEAPPATVPGCKFVAQASRRPDYLETFESIPIASLPVNVSTQRLFTAGGYLTLTVQPMLDANDRISLKLFAKPSGDGPFKLVCENVRLKGGRMGLLEVNRPGIDQYSIWRAEFTVERQPTTPASQGNIVLGRELVLVAPDPFRAEPGWNNARGLICFNRITNRLAIVTSSSNFAGRTRLNVKVPAGGSNPLTQKQLEATEVVVLQAAALWVHACVVCKPDNLSVISVNGRVFVHDGLFRLGGEPRLIGQSPPALEPKTAENLLRSFIGTSRVGVGSPQPYRAVPSPRTYFEEFCAVRTTESSATPTLKRVQEALCAAQAGPGLAANIRVAFKDGNTACGDDSDIIGCRADHELTEYNTRDYRFVARPSGVSIGNGKVEVDLLQAVLHEMGHWIGLEHIDGGESIMSSSLERSRCIDFETVKAVAEQVAVIEGETPPSIMPQAFKLRASSAREQTSLNGFLRRK